MELPARVLCIMDIACVGRAGLSAAMPALAACGAQCCALPTSVLSAHLGGFGRVEQQDLAAFCTSAIADFRREGLAFDVLYTGYLTGEEQFALAHAAFDAWPAAYKVVDPVLADGGRLYSKTTQGIVRAMQALAQRADLVTPNLTEAALLLGRAPEALPTADELPEVLRQLARGRAVVVTSARLHGGSGIAGRDADGEAWQLGYEAVEGSFPGTGDLYAAVLTGLASTGTPLKAASRAACRFVSEAVRHTAANGGEVRHGVWFEPLLARIEALRAQECADA